MMRILFLIALTGLLGGGYFLSVSALMGILLLAMLLYRIWCPFGNPAAQASGGRSASGKKPLSGGGSASGKGRKKEIRIAVDWNLLAFGVLAASHLLVSLWAVDSGMALLGFVKFLPLFLFYLYVSGVEEEREKVIAQLPMLGALMTLFSFLMMQFPVFEKWVSVAGRLAGFFQYPNTYAVFLLVCLIIVLYRFDRTHVNLFDALYAAAALFGIYMSGSRAVYVLTLLTLLYIGVPKAVSAMRTRSRQDLSDELSLSGNPEKQSPSDISSKKVRKRIFLGAAAAVAVAAVVLLAGGGEMFSRLTDISFRSSTFLGRLLYAKDALPMIFKNPMGLGYYGYYFMQQSAQTGVYSVVNVHNELLQVFLDIGIVPSVVVCAALFRSVISKRTAGRNRLVLLVMLLHSLFDYDFQFLVMGFVLILFLDMQNVKVCKIPSLTKGVASAAGAGALLLSVVTGLSDIAYTSGNYERASRFYSGNTMAQLQLLTRADTPEEMRRQAEALLAKNRYLSVAYSAKAKAALSEGDIESFIKDKETAISLAPYQHEEYTDYLEMLAYCESLYLRDGSIKDAQICVERAENIPKQLKKVEKKTSALAWEIRDKPRLMLSSESLELIENMKEQVNENQ